MTIQHEGLRLAAFNSALDSIDAAEGGGILCSCVDDLPFPVRTPEQLRARAQWIAEVKLGARTREGAAILARLGLVSVYDAQRETEQGPGNGWITVQR